MGTARTFTCDGFSWLLRGTLINVGERTARDQERTELIREEGLYRDLAREHGHIMEQLLEEKATFADTQLE